MSKIDASNYDSYINEFTNKKYLSKQSLKNQLKEDYEEIIWLQIQQYRNKHRINTNLKTSTNRNIGVSITPTIIKKEIWLHKAISEIKLKSFMYNQLFQKYEVQPLLKLKQELVLDEVINVTEKGYEFKIEKNILLDIVTAKYKANDEPHHFAAKYFEFLSSLEDQREITSRTISEWNAKLCNQDINTVLRKENISDKRKLSMTYNKMIDYEGFDCDELRERMQDLDKFISKTEESNTFISAAIVYYYIKYGRFFNKYNDITAIMAFYLMIAHEYPDIACILGFGSLIIEHFKEAKIAFVNSEASDDDASYVVHFIFETLSAHFNKIIKLFDDKLDTAEHNYSLKQDNEISLSLQAKRLQSENPNISSKQATFFVAHKEKNIAYSISDFRSYTNSSYETSRYSLDNLVKLGYYVKEKIGKKFVYQIPSEEIINNE